jgi:tetratricopeptide (TPR) repeat protein
VVTEQRQSSLNGPSLAGTFVLIFFAIAALAATDTFLAKVERTEGQAEARRLLVEGQRLVQRGRDADAINKFRSALSVSRGNQEAQLGLAGALLAVGRLTDAETLLQEMLRRSATDGAANLTMARVMVKEGRSVEATSYYHQSIYGRWSQDARANRVKVRFELIEVLVRQNADREVLAELLPLQDEAPDDIQTRKRIARVYLSAGSPSRALDLFREILRQQPQDFDAYAGLGEAEFARGNYRIARTDFKVALRLNPADEEIGKRLGVCETVLTLDPTQRGLSTAERYRRGIKLVELALEGMNRCVGTPPPADVSDLAEKAKQALMRRVSFARQDEVTEANLDLADQLWQARQKQCKQAPAEADEPLALVIAKLAQ